MVLAIVNGITKTYNKATRAISCCCCNFNETCEIDLS